MRDLQRSSISIDVFPVPVIYRSSRDDWHIGLTAQRAAMPFFSTEQRFAMAVPCFWSVPGERKTAMLLVAHDLFRGWFWAEHALFHGTAVKRNLGARIQQQHGHAAERASPVLPHCCQSTQQRWSTDLVRALSCTRMCALRHPHTGGNMRGRARARACTCSPTARIERDTAVSGRSPMQSCAASDPLHSKSAES